jgi:hypothetical protein
VQPSEQAEYSRAQPGAVPPAGQAGAISGHLSTPADVVVAQAVYAISVDGRTYYRTESVLTQAVYTMAAVAAGDYFVFSDARSIHEPDPSTPYDRFKAAYTPAIACGLSVACTDHSPIRVHVTAGHTTAGIDPVDWYNIGYPYVPGNPVYGPATQPAGFATADWAATFAGQDWVRAVRVAAQAQCPINTACFWLDGGHSGQHAMYYLAGAGSNGYVVRCGLYVVVSGSGWQPFSSRCQGTTGITALIGITAVGSTMHTRLGRGATGCTNAYGSPTATALVVRCVAADQAVTIDGGPFYESSTSPDMPDGLWWHLAGIGWVEDRHLVV